MDPTFTAGATAALERSINAVLALDPDTAAALARLEGRVIALEIRGTGITLYLLPQRDGLRVMRHFDGAVDTTLSGPPLALLRMSTSSRPGTGLFGGDVTIAGDTELGQKVQRILGDLDTDWEEHLSRLTGDVVAHQVGNAVRGIGDFIRRAGDTVGRDVAEYLQEESDTLPSRIEAEEQFEAIEATRAAVDRLEARLALLEQQGGRGE